MRNIVITNFDIGMFWPIRTGYSIYYRKHHVV